MSVRFVPLCVHLLALFGTLAMGTNSARADIVLQQTPVTPIVSASPSPVPGSALSQAGQLILEIGAVASAVPIAGSPLVAAGATVVFLDAMVNLGSSIWNVLEKGAPSVDVTSSVANALPQGVSGAMDLENWQTPVVREYCVPMDDDPHFDCDPGIIYSHYNLHFRVSFIPGGDLQGHGKYLTGVMIQPEFMDVGYNENLSAQTAVVSVSNIGTELDPVAAMRITFSWLLSEYNGYPFGQSLGFLITGDGKIIPDAKSVITTPPPPPLFPL